MRNKTFKLSLLTAVISILAIAGFGYAQDFIQITPSTLNTIQFTGTHVTVHVAVPYVSTDQVSMVSEHGAVNAVYTFADDRYELVAKFPVADVIGIAPVGDTHVLSILVNGDSVGSDELTVIEEGKSL